MIRPSRPQARPLWQGTRWRIDRQDVLELLGVVAMVAGFVALVRWVS